MILYSLSLTLYSSVNVGVVIETRESHYVLYDIVQLYNVITLFSHSDKFYPQSFVKGV